MRVLAPGSQATMGAAHRQHNDYPSATNSYSTMVPYQGDVFHVSSGGIFPTLISMVIGLGGVDGSRRVRDVAITHATILMSSSSGECLSLIHI